MQQDQSIAWDGPFPYETLEPAGITINSSMTDILKAMSHFSRSKTSNQAVRAAWTELRKPECRLFYDFFLYQIDDSIEKGQSGP